MSGLATQGLLALAIILSITGSSAGQALPLFPATNGVDAPTASSDVAIAGSSQPALDFSLINWRMGYLSPYMQQSLTGSVTSSTQSVTSATVTTNNPFVGSTIGMQGAMTTSTAVNSSTSNTFSVSSNVSTPTNMYFASRFVSFTDLRPNYGLNTTLTNTSNNISLTPIISADTNSSSDRLITSVPEPRTMILCAGLLAMVGYGWSRRKIGLQGNEALETK